MTTEYRRRARFPYLVHCLRSSNAEQPVLTRSDVGSSPTGGTTRTGSLGATLRSQRSLGGFETRRPLHARAVQRVNAGSTCRRSLVRSQPRAPRSCSSSGQGNRALNPGTRVRFPYTTLSMFRTTPSSNGSGSEITNFRMVVRVHPGSLLGRDLGSSWRPRPTSGVRFLDGLRARRHHRRDDHGEQLTWG